MRALLLFAACVASLLAASGVYARVEDRGEGSCGIRQQWRLDGGVSKTCCTDPSLGSVTRFEYYVEKDGAGGEPRDAGGGEEGVQNPATHLPSASASHLNRFNKTVTKSI